MQVIGSSEVGSERVVTEACASHHEHTSFTPSRCRYGAPEQQLPWSRLAGTVTTPSRARLLLLLHNAIDYDFSDLAAMPGCRRCWRALCVLVACCRPTSMIAARSSTSCHVCDVDATSCPDLPWVVQPAAPSSRTDSRSMLVVVGI